MASLLSVEDDADLQQALGMALYSAGFDMHYAFNGKEGLDKVLSLHPDLVLLDLMLPMMSGQEVLKRMRATPELKTLPVIVLTAMADDENKLERELKNLGSVWYVRKPFNLRELTELIRRVLKTQAAQLPAPPSVSKGALRLDPKCRTLWIQDRLIATLSPKKARLVQALLESQGPVKRLKLLEKVWDREGEINTLEKT